MAIDASTNELEIQKNMWEQYLFLSNELLKFCQEEDVDMIEKLLNEREKNQQVIDGWNNQIFIVSTEGQKLKKNIHLINEKILQMLQKNVNFLKQAKHVSDAYDGFGAIGRGSSVMDFGA